MSFNSYNHVTNSGFQYDAAGNMTHDANHSYTYDAENRITQVDGGSTATYTYDAQGRRISKVVGGVETDYLYDLSGHVVAAYGGGCGSTCLNTAFVYSNGQLLAEYGGATYFVSADHLGSTRLLTNVSGGVVDNMDYLPFGEQIAGASTTTHKFTGYERDAESGLDNAQARYNSSSLGRFMSPDPDGAGAESANPQSWNMYSYVLNSPLGGTDPDGLDCVTPLGWNEDGTLAVMINGGQCHGSGGTYVNGTVDVSSLSLTESNGSASIGYNYKQYDSGSAAPPILSVMGVSPNLDSAARGALSWGIGMSSAAVTPAFWTTMTFTFAPGLPMLDAMLTGTAIGGLEPDSSVGEVSAILEKAGSAVGNQGIQASSRQVAEQAAQDWVGAGARDIVDRQTGQVVGKISADGIKVARFTSANKPQPYINLVDKITGSNLHVRF